MKVLVLLPAINLGGLEMLNLAIAKYVGKSPSQKIDFTFMIPKHGDLKDQFVNSGANVVFLENFSSIFLLKKIRKFCEEHQIDVVHTHHPKTALLTRFSLIGTRIKSVMSIHGYTTKKRNFQQFIHHLILNLSILFTPKIICVSKTFAELIQRKTILKKRQLKVVYNTTDESSFSTKKSAYIESFKQKDTFIIGMVGNFVPEKDQLTVCKAFNHFQKKHPNSHLFFVGQRFENYAYCFNECNAFVERENLSNKVSFLGRRNDVPELLNSFDLFILSSLEDSFGIALVEAMLHKTPCIVSDIPPFIEISNEGKYALLFKKQDEIDLDNKMEYIYQNNNLQEELIENAFQFCKETFSIEQHLEQLFKVYQNVSHLRKN